MLSRLQCAGARCVASPHQTPAYNYNSYRRSTRRYIMPSSAQLRSQVSLLLVDLAGTTLITSPARRPPTASATNASFSRNTEHMALLKKDRGRTPRNCASGYPHFRARLSITGGGRVQRSNFSFHADSRSYSRRGCRASIPIRRS